MSWRMRSALTGRPPGLVHSPIALDALPPGYPVRHAFGLFKTYCTKEISIPAKKGFYAISVFCGACFTKPQSSRATKTPCFNISNAISGYFSAVTAREIHARSVCAAPPCCFMPGLPDQSRARSLRVWPAKERLRLRCGRILTQAPELFDIKMR